jgi:hypothetical protein
MNNLICNLPFCEPVHLKCKKYKHECLKTKILDGRLCCSSSAAVLVEKQQQEQLLFNFPLEKTFFPLREVAPCKLFSFTPPFYFCLFVCLSSSIRDCHLASAFSYVFSQYKAELNPANLFD